MMELTKDLAERLAKEWIKENVIFACADYTYDHDLPKDAIEYIEKNQVMLIADHILKSKMYTKTDEAFGAHRFMKIRVGLLRPDYEDSALFLKRKLED